MSVLPTSPSFVLKVQELMSSAWSSVQGLFGHQDFSPEASLAATKGLDRFFIPRAPMSNANLDVGTLNQLSRMGLRRSKEITPETHPEICAVWAVECKRAGLAHIPQLIVSESPSINAMAISGDEVMMTTGIMKLLNFRELTAVLGHEAAHVASNHTTPRIAATAVFSGGAALLGNWFANRGGPGRLVSQTVEDPSWLRKAFKFFYNDGSRPASLMATSLYISAAAGLGTIIANQASIRPTELDADRKSVAISGDAEGLISALSKLNARGEKTAMQHFHHLRSGYPTIEHRIEKLREIGASMPNVEPVIKEVQRQAATAAVAPQPPASAPASQVRDVALAARVGEALPAQAAAL